MKKILTILLIVVILIAGGFWAYRHFVTDQIMDRGGMENPDYDPGNEIVLDGDQTYVDNDALLPVLAGTWESADGRYEMTLTEGYELRLTLDGETVLEDKYDFSYLLPSASPSTELRLNAAELTHPDGTVISQIAGLYHEVSDSDETGRIVLSLWDDDLKTEEIEFTKQ